jgi:hypothetical protein
MTHPRHRIALVAALALAAAAPAARADDGAPLPETQWLMHGGVDIGRDHSRGVSVSADYTGRTNATALDSRYWDAGAGFSRSQSTVKATLLRPSTETRTGAGSGYATYGNERWRGVLGFDAAKDEGFRKSQRVSLGVDFAHGGFDANLTASRRRTVFDDFTISVQAAEALGISLPSAITVDCSITDNGLGAKAAYSGATWGVYASSNTYHYKKAACSSNLAIADQLRRLSGEDFFALGGRFFDRARARVGGRIGQNSRLLKSEFAAGFSFDLWIPWAVDYSRDKDQFGEASTSNYSVSGTLRLSSNVSLDLTLGNTSGDGGSAQYVGAMLAVAL